MESSRPVEDKQVIDFSALTQADVDAIARGEIALPDYFEVVEPDTANPVHLISSVNTEGYFACNPTLIDNDRDGSKVYESIVSTQWVYKKAQPDRDEVGCDAERSGLFYNNTLYKDVKDSYALEPNPAKSFVLTQLYRSAHHQPLSPDEFYEKIKKHYSQSMSFLFFSCMGLAVQKSQTKKTQYTSPNPAYRNEGLYCDSQGDIRLKVVHTHFLAKTLDGANQEIPGTTAFEFVLTDRGFKLDWLAFSNSLIRDLCLYDRVDNLPAKIEEAAQHERAQAFAYANKLVAQKAMQEADALKSKLAAEKTQLEEREKAITPKEQALAAEEARIHKDYEEAKIVIDQADRIEKTLAAKEKQFSALEARLGREKESQDKIYQNLKAREVALVSTSQAVKGMETANLAKKKKLDEREISLAPREEVLRRREQATIDGEVYLARRELVQAAKEKNLKSRIQQHEATEAAKFSNRYPNLHTFLIVMGIIMACTLLLALLCCAPVVGPVIAAGLSAALTWSAGMLGISALVAGMSSVTLGMIAAGIVGGLAAIACTIACGIKAICTCRAAPTNDHTGYELISADKRVTTTSLMDQMGSTGPVLEMQQAAAGDDTLADVSALASSPLQIAAQQRVPTFVLSTRPK